MRTKLRLSLLASTLLLASSAMAADSIKEAFENGKASGDITIYTNVADDSTNKTGFTAGSFGLTYETDSVNGFSARASFRANHEFTEKNTGDYAGAFSNESIMNEAVITYANDDVSLSVGRQEIDLEWMGDFHESIVLGINSIEDTEIVLGFSDRFTAVAEDESADFADSNSDKGAYVLDVKYTGIENVELNPYFYSASDVANFYGLKAGFSVGSVDLTAHYAASNEDTATVDSNIIHIGAETEVEGFALAAGYIKTDEDIASIKSFGENIDPTEELGDYVYGVDATTVYASVGYAFEAVELSALYADTDYATNSDAKELSLGLTYAITEELAFGAIYSDFEVNNVDNDKLSASLVYSF